MPVDLHEIEWDAETIYEYSDEYNGQGQEMIYIYNSDSIIGSL